MRYESFSTQITMASAKTADTNVGPMHDLTAFQRDVLVVVRELGEPHGLGIKEEMSKLYDGKEIHHGRLYPNLDELVEKGLVEKGELDQRTNYYALTDRGRRDVEADMQWRQNGGAE